VVKAKGILLYLVSWSLTALVLGALTGLSYGQGAGGYPYGYTLYRSDGKAILQVAKEDFAEKMTWQDAGIRCSSLGEGWRLPTRDELDMMYLQLYKKGLGSFKPYWYWSKSQFVMHMYYGSGFVSNDFYSQFNEFHVRAVRPLPTD